MASLAHIELRQAAPVEYISFLLGDELFAVRAASVREIIEARAPMAVLKLPPCVLGVINLRGAAVAVTDVGRRDGRGVCAVSQRSCIIVVDLGGEILVGVLADAVNAMLTTGVEDLAAPSSLAGDPAFYGGMAAMSGEYEGRYARLLDVQLVLSPDDIGAAVAALADCHSFGALP